MLNLKGRENAYECPVCGGYTTTVNVDDGVTPMFLACRVTPGCPGRAASLIYPEGPRPAHIPPPAWEWYRPSRRERRSLDPVTREHVEMGGLLIRERHERA